MCLIFLISNIFLLKGNFFTKSGTSSQDNVSNIMLKSASSETTAIEDTKCYLVLDSDNTHFLPNENIILSYYVSSEENIKNYSYSQNGFNVISITTKEDDWHIAV